MLPKAIILKSDLVFRQDRDTDGIRLPAGTRVEVFGRVKEQTDRTPYMCFHPTVPEFFFVGRNHEEIYE